MGLHRSGKEYTDAFRWRSVVGEFMGEDSQNGVNFTRLHCPWRVQIDGDIFFSDFCVTEAIALKFSDPAFATPKRGECETGKTEHATGTVKHMFYQCFVPGVERVVHAASLLCDFWVCSEIGISNENAERGRGIL